MVDASAEGSINFGEIFANKIPTNSDFEHDMLTYSKPNYSSNWSAFQTCKIQPVVQPYDSPTQTLRYEIGGVDDPLYTHLTTMKVLGRLRVLNEDGSSLNAWPSTQLC